MHILFIGSSTLDVFADAREAELIDIQKQHGEEKLFCIAYGSKTNLADVDLAAGGSAANSAITARALGAKVELLSAVGGDGIGRIILEELKRHGLPTKLVKKMPKEKSAVGMNILARGGEKSILVYRGATDKLGTGDIQEAEVRKCDAIFFASLPSLDNYGLFLKALELAGKFGKKTVFAPSISMIGKRSEQLRRLDYRFSLAIMNEEEAKALSEEKDAKTAAEKLAESAEVVVVTLAEKGAIAFDGRRHYAIGAVPVQVKSTTGAGDAFSGAFAFEFLTGKGVEQSLKTATAVAAVKLGHTHAAFTKTRKEVNEFLKTNRQKLKVKNGNK